MTIELETVVDTYLVAYANPDAAERTAQVERIWAPDGRLIDPPADAAGTTAIAGMFAALVAQFPGHSFRRTTAIDAHHGFARYGWDLVGPDGATVLSGMDVAQVDDGGRLQQVVGFFGPLAAQG